MRIDNVMRSIVQPQPTGTKPAQLNISESMKAQENAYAQGSDNARDAINLANTTEGSLDSVQDSLKRIHELALQALNSTNTDEDQAIIQNEVDDLLTGIEDTLRNTEFNTIRVLDGFEGNIQTGATQGRTMEVQNTTLETLGLDNLDVTDASSLEAIEGASSQVSDARAQLGAQTSGLESTIRSNDIARENTLSSRTNFDEDLAKQITELKRLQITQTYQYQLQNKEAEDKERNTLNLFEV